MRRLLAIVLAAGPLAATAQTSGQILFDGSSTSPTMNVAQCNGAQASDTYTLTWTIQLTSGSTFPTGGGGEYRVYAGTGDPGNTTPYCYMPGATGQTVAEVATDPASPGVTSMTSSASVTTSALRTAAGYDCTTDKTIYVCVAWYSDAATTDPALFQGYAKGRVTLSVSAPNAPTVADVWPGNEALVVDLTDNGGAAVATTWQAKAVNVADAADVHTSSWSGSLSGLRIEGLVNGTSYTVTAFARSDALNVSPESAAFGSAVAPQAVRDDWQHYKDLGGCDSGGCDTGPAGVLALLGAAALLRLGRRS